MLQDKMERIAKTVWLKHFVDEGVPKPTDFEIHETKVNAKEMQEGDVLVESLVMSVDPYLRGMIKSASNPGKSGKFPMNGFVAVWFFKRKAHLSKAFLGQSFGKQE